MSDESDEEVILLRRGAAPGLQQQGEEEDGGSSSGEEDDLAFLGKLQRAGGSGEKVLVTRDPFAEPTRAVTLQHRAEKDQEARREKRTALHALTLKNLRAAENSGWQDGEDEPKAEAEQPEVQEEQNASAEAKFAALVEAGKAKVQEKDWEGAKAVLQQGLEFCAEHPHKLAWRASMGYTMGSVLLQLGDVRLAIGELLTALQATRSSPSSASKLETSILGQLAQAYSDIGKMSDADACQRELEALSGKQSTSSAQSAQNQQQQQPARRGGDNRDGNPPAAVAASLDEAIEAAIKGHFGFLRALLNAFRDGRGEVSLSQVVNYQHSATLATPLMVSAAKGELSLVQALLHAGARVNTASADGSSALVWACRFDQPAVMRTLLEAGAQFDASITPAVIESWSGRVQQEIANFISSRKYMAAQAVSRPPSQPPQPPQQQNQQTQQNSQPQQQQQEQQQQSKRSKKKKKPKGGPRDLEKWNDDGGDQGNAAASAGAATGGSLADQPQGDWDQFKANEALGVTADSFDENLYTTKLDIDSIPAEVQAQADALYESMQREKASNPRAQKNPEADEEALYSAVARSTEGQTHADGFTDAAVLRRQKKGSSKGKPPKQQQKPKPKQAAAKGKGAPSSG